MTAADQILFTGMFCLVVGHGLARLLAYYERRRSVHFRRALQREHRQRRVLKAEWAAYLEREKARERAAVSALISTRCDRVIVAYPPIMMIGGTASVS